MDPLLEPFEINGMKLKNRIITTAHAPFGMIGTDGLPTERYIAYQEEKAAGGLSLLLFGGSSYVAEDSVSFFDSIDAGHERISEYYREIAERVHRHGAKAIVQITHLGRRANDKAATWLPTLAPSAIRERAHRSYPKVIEEFDFPRILEAYAQAARFAKDGGLDGVELAALSGHLPDTFMAERANTRDDEYGGSLRARTKFTLDVIEAIRSEVGDDWVVGIRMPGQEGSPDALSAEECIEIARIINEQGLVDFYDVMYGSGFTFLELGDQMPSSGTPLGAFLHMARAVRDVVDKPVIHAGRIADLATARHALREDLIDLVGMTRAHIADPHIVRKLEAGQAERIRPCVGASHCLQGVETLCIHNPATGREGYIPQLISPGTGERLRVTVVGGGPAGLEAARVSAERGHDVTLYEAADRFGGQMIPMTRSNRQSEKWSIIEWLTHEAKHAGARLLTNHFVDEDDVVANQPDVVIIATGGQPNMELPHGGGELALSSIDALSQTPPTNTSVIIYDEHGGEQALVVAEHVAEGTGNTVEIVTADEAIGHDVGHTIIPGYKRRLYSAGVTVTPDSELVSLEGKRGDLTLTLRNVMTGATQQRHSAVVVVERGMLPLDDVYHALKPLSSNGGAMDLKAFSRGLPQPHGSSDEAFRLYRVGDAVAFRGIHTAIFDARRLCMNM